MLEHWKRNDKGILVVMKRILNLLSFMALLIGAKAQTITPSVISCVGGYGYAGNFCISWTAGETIGTTLNSGNIFLTQGFHQPLSDSTPVTPVDTNKIWNAITPNGDNFNDMWVIDWIDTLDNNVMIFNRWGDVVWNRSDYNNTTVAWKGDNKTGADLPAGTYFYVITLKDKPPLTGWIELLR
jgi:gliding motility-associated-like protein